jgi:hypothetical protein
MSSASLRPRQHVPLVCGYRTSWGRSPIQRLTMATDWPNLSPDGLNRTRNVVRIPPSVRRAEYAQAVIANTRPRSQRAYMAGGVVNDLCEGIINGEKPPASNCGACDNCIFKCYCSSCRIGGRDADHCYADHCYAFIGVFSA